MNRTLPTPTPGSRWRRPPSALGTALVAVLRAAPGCSDDDERSRSTGPPRPPAYRAPTSAENVLANLELAYRAKHIDGYDAVTHGDFVFEASPDDPDVAFETLDAAGDHASTVNMFASVISVAIDLGELATGPSTDDAYPDSLGYLEVDAEHVYISIETRIDGELWTLKVEGDPARFIVAPDSASTPVMYALIHQYDLDRSGWRPDRVTAETSWGSLKSLFR